MDDMILQYIEKPEDAIKLPELVGQSIKLFINELQVKLMHRNLVISIH